MRITAPDQVLDRKQVARIPETVRPHDHRLDMPERDLQAAVIDLAAHLGYMHYHTHDARRSPYGFPDLVLVNPPRRRTLFVELKSMKGHVTQAQAEWLTGLASAGNHVHLWTPADWISGAVERELRGPRI